MGWNHRTRKGGGGEPDNGEEKACQASADPAKFSDNSHAEKKTNRRGNETERFPWTELYARACRREKGGEKVSIYWVKEGPFRSGGATSLQESWEGKVQEEGGVKKLACKGRPHCEGASTEKEEALGYPSLWGERDPDPPLQEGAARA